MLEADPRPILSLNLLTSSTGALQLRYGPSKGFPPIFVPRLSTSTLHEPTTAASNHPRAPHVQSLCVLTGPQCPVSLLSTLGQSSQCLRSRAALAPTATLDLSRSRSTTNKIHRLARRAASFKSLYALLPDHRDRLTFVMWLPQIEH